MALDIEKVLTQAVEDGIRDGIKSKLSSSYGDNPILPLVTEVLKKHDAKFREMLSDALASAIGDAEFRNEIRIAVRHTLAKTLISRFGGELEKQVNVLKSDPSTRARITLAIEEIVKEKCTA
jgi:hypothetical protein